MRYDERGCGLSDWAVEDLSFESWVRDLEVLADTVGAERFALLGMSQGASIAIAYAVRHPERVSHLVLHGGYARGRLVRSNTAAEREEVETMNKLAELGWGKTDPSFRQFFTSQFIPGGRPEQHQWFNELERISTSPANAVRFMREFARIDVSALLPQVRCPTLVLHSRHEVRQPFEQGRLLATGIAGAQLVPIDSGNHLLLEDEAGWTQWIEGGARLPAALGGRRAAGVREPHRTSARTAGADRPGGATTRRSPRHCRSARRTVRNHITHIFAKLEVESRAQAIVRARDSGFGRLDG